MCKLIDLIGQRFDRWLVLKRVVSSKGSRTKWLCRCDCGVYRKIDSSNLKSGKTKSCGCLKNEMLRKRKTTHNLTKHPLYSVWSNMKTRCTNKNEKRYSDYGGRGISICIEWMDSFESFYYWCVGNGYEEGLQIDRINNNGDYEPQNCRFVTPMDNSLNKRVYKNNMSGYVGVRVTSNGKFRSRITDNKKLIHLGYFDSISEAVRARNYYIIKNGTKHKLTNIPF